MGQDLFVLFTSFIKSESLSGAAGDVNPKNDWHYCRLRVTRKYESKNYTL